MFFKEKKQLEGERNWKKERKEEKWEEWRRKGKEEKGKKDYYKTVSPKLAIYIFFATSFKRFSHNSTTAIFIFLPGCLLSVTGHQGSPYF